MATDLMSSRRRYGVRKTEPQLDDPERLYGGETGMNRVGGTAPKSAPLAAVANKPAAGLYPPGTARSSNDRVAADGTITTTRATPAQVANKAAFDRSQGFTPTGEKPAYQQIQEARDARLKADPYDLDFASDYSGTHGSQQRTLGPYGSAPPPVTAPAATSRPTGLAVKAIGNAGPLETVGNKAAAPLASVAYRPTTEPAAALPVTRYDTSAAVPAMTPAPMATPSAPLPAPTLAGATPSAANAPMPTATPAPTAMPAATPQLMPTPGTSDGARLASGVSNSSAAQFEQPTASNPVPTTPTTPVADVEDYDKKNKTKFLGF